METRTRRADPVLLLEGAPSVGEGAQASLLGTPVLGVETARIAGEAPSRPAEAAESATDFPCQVVRCFGLCVFMCV